MTAMSTGRIYGVERAPPQVHDYAPMTNCISSNKHASAIPSVAFGYDVLPARCLAHHLPCASLCDCVRLPLSYADLSEDGWLWDWFSVDRAVASKQGYPSSFDISSVQVLCECASSVSSCSFTLFLRQSRA
jgi:hypothetical protein